ncbi:MAG: GNAT family N-acetyltransferase [Pseudomonadota bacterium]|uniref:GNAT family N-acetyltransferase n=1 Tax=Polaromonas sp. TaxID=1869339 RepID=UPI0017B4ADC7|nr:GNAT family N-acetyltransferase [Polaromonas sp.]MBA3595383.1 GNAT family N-acetyltransferase [Polaromonas sp.]MDQ3272234.1 GNAT family N-acetyltransferase [Pseudomonadota bacterium]
MRIEPASNAHHESLIDLLCELHTYYNEGSVASREIVREHLLDNLLGPQSPHRLIVAVSDSDTVAGLAALTLAYSLVEPAPNRRRHCQLKELYVLSSERSKGVGAALMLGVARFALENGCHRIDWPVKASNLGGIAFYEGLGAERVAERLSYRLTEPGIRQLAGLGSEASRGG